MTSTHSPPEQLASFCDEEEWLVPIRLEFEHETQKVRDVFTWNMRGPSASSMAQWTSLTALADAQVTPEAFVKTLLEDLCLPAIPFHRELVTQLHAQLEDSRRIAFRDNVFPAHHGDDLDDLRAC